MPKKDVEFYKRILMNQLSVLKQYQKHRTCGRAVCSACKVIRAALYKPPSLDQIKIISRACGLMLRALSLPPGAW